MSLPSVSASHELADRQPCRGKEKSDKTWVNVLEQKRLPPHLEAVGGVVSNPRSFASVDGPSAVNKRRKMMRKGIICARFLECHAPCP